MTADIPIKRDECLKPLSRDHHHGLLLCWKIKTGFSKDVEVQRIKTYADWFYKKYLLPHFETEEKYLFPVLGNENKHIMQALDDHRRITNLFKDTSDIEDSMKKIPVELEKHIRFEERTLFNEIQNTANPDQLKKICKEITEEKFEENIIDEFWK